MRREGSPWTGLGAVFLKELADNLSSVRMRVLEWLVVLIGIAAVYAAIQDVKSLTAQDPFLFLRLFTHAREPLPSCIALLGILIPLVAIGLGFDAVNGEFSRRTMSRVLSQPIYRDALLLGKFLGGLATLGVSLLALWLLIFGLGLLLLGVPPGGEEVARALCFLVVALAYAGVWLAAAILFSVLFRSAATSALCTLGLWLFFSLLWPVLVRVLVQVAAPSDMALLLGVQSPEQVRLELGLSRFAPNTLFIESVLGLLNPSVRTLGPVYFSDLIGSVPGAPLPFLQSLLIVWPQVTGLIAAAIVLFAITYVAFQRQEIRA